MVGKTKWKNVYEIGTSVLLKKITYNCLWSVMYYEGVISYPSNLSIKPVFWRVWIVMEKSWSCGTSKDFRKSGIDFWLWFLFDETIWKLLAFRVSLFLKRWKKKKNPHTSENIWKCSGIAEMHGSILWLVNNLERRI